MGIFDRLNIRKDEDQNRVNIKNIDRPSVSIKNQKKIKKCVEHFRKMQSEFQRDYPNAKFDKSYSSNSLKIELLNIHLNEVKVFAVMKIGDLNMSNKIWTWAWIDENQKFDPSSPLVKLRNYGFHNKIELLTKTKWRASLEDAEKMCAVSLVLKKGLGVIERENGSVIEYFLIQKPT